MSTFLLFPNSKSILERCLTLVYVNKLDFNNNWIIQLLSALKVHLYFSNNADTYTCMYLYLGRKNPRMFCQIKDAITQWPNCCWVWALLKSCSPKYSEKITWSVSTFLLHILFWLFPLFPKFILLLKNKISVFLVQIIGYDGVIKNSQFRDKTTLFFPILSALVPVPKSRKKSLRNIFRFSLILAQI